MFKIKHISFLQMTQNLPSVTWEILHGHCSGPLGHTALKVSRVILGEHLEMTGHLMVTLWGETKQLLLRSAWTKVFESAEFTQKMV